MLVVRVLCAPPPRHPVARLPVEGRDRHQLDGQEQVGGVIGESGRLTAERTVFEVGGPTHWQPSCQSSGRSVSRSVGETRGEPTLQRHPGALRVLSQKDSGIFFSILSTFIFLNPAFPPLPLHCSSLLALLHVRGWEPAHLHGEEPG